MSHIRNLGDLSVRPAQVQRGAIIDLRDEADIRRLNAVELDSLVQAVSRGLARRGILRGMRVGIVAENRFEFLASYFGIMRFGAVAVPVNHKLPAATIEFIFKDSDITLTFCDAARRSMVPSHTPIIDFDAVGSEGFGEFLDYGRFETVAPDEHLLAEILYTSGSTGRPKGVPLTHAGQAWAIEQYLTPLSAELPTARTLIVAPLYHMNALFNVTFALAEQVEVILLPKFDARRYLETVARYRCSLLSGIPTMFALMVRERDLVERLDLASVQHVTIGSAPLTDALLSEVKALFPNAEVENGYGTTEAGPAVFGPHPQGLARPPLSIGYPLPNIECVLLDGDSTDQGVLALRTDALMHGYLNLPEATASRMRGGLYVTGDIMRRDGQGFYYFVGRADDMFVCGGENIYPGEVEKLLERHPDVAQAIVVAAPDDIKGQIPIAFIVRRPGRNPSVADIKHYALSEGPAYAHPRLVEFRESLPVSGTHKIDRTALTLEAERLVKQAGRSH